MSKTTYKKKSLKKTHHKRKHHKTSKKHGKKKHHPKKSHKKRTRKVKKTRHYRRRRTGGRKYYGGQACDTYAKTNMSPSYSGVVPQELVNMGRSIKFGAEGAHAAIMGNEAPVDPLPFNDQLNGGQIPDDVLLRT